MKAEYTNFLRLPVFLLVERWVFCVAPWFCLQQLLHKSSRSMAGLVGHTLSLDSTGFERRASKWVEGFSQHVAALGVLAATAVINGKGTHSMSQQGVR